MNENSNEPKNNRRTILGITVILIILCLFVLLFVFSYLNTRYPLFSKKDTPSHYGVFIKEDDGLVELNEREIISIPLDKELQNIQVIYDPQPIIIIWLQDISLDNLELRKISQYRNQSEIIQFNTNPKDNNFFEISPLNHLTQGKYCIFLGDPLGLSIPGWCFQVGDTEAINEYEVITPENITKLIPLEFTNQENSFGTFEYLPQVTWLSDSLLVYCKWERLNNLDMEELYYYDLNTLAFIEAKEIPYINCEGVSPNGKYVAAYKMYYLYLYNLETEEEIELTYNRDMSPVTFSQDNNYLASLSDEGNLLVWNIEGELINKASENQYKANDFVFSPNNNLIAYAGWNGIGIIDLKTFEQKIFIENRNTRPSDVRFSPDGNKIAVSFWKENINVALYNVVDGNEIQTFSDPENYLYTGDIAFSPDGKVLGYLVYPSGSMISYENVLTFWDVGKKQIISRSAEASIYNGSELNENKLISFSPNGKFLSVGYNLYVVGP